MSVIGIDASSSRLAGVVLDHGAMHTVELRLSSDITKACQESFGWMGQVRSAYTPRLIAVEAPFFHRLHPSGSVGLAQVNGSLLAATAGSTTLSVAPSHWKKSVVGRGNASKDEVSAWVAAHHPEKYDFFVKRGKLSQDLVDAFCIALHATHVLEIRARLLTTR